jgi:hypothetical protein
MLLLGAFSGKLCHRQFAQAFAELLAAAPAHGVKAGPQ